MVTERWRYLKRLTWKRFGFVVENGENGYDDPEMRVKKERPGSSKSPASAYRQALAPATRG
jgi:hypothetical protein